jgi:AAA domain
MSTDDNDDNYDWLPNALPFEMFDESAKNVEKKWLLKGLIALGEDSSWFGPPGSMKSSLLLDMAFHIAWRRHRFWHEYVYAKEEIEELVQAEPRGSIYFAPERADLVRARMGAYKTRDKPEVPLPISIVSRMINLLDPACVDQITETVWRMEDLTKVPVGLLIFDTFSKAITSGDEDKAQTQNLAAANLARIHEMLDVHIATIGHTGNNPSAGERGSNAREGHVDLQVQISGDDKVRTATVVKANDQEKRLVASFQIEKVTVVRPDLEPYTATILKPATPATAGRPAASQRTTVAQAIEALKRVVATHGQDGAVHVDFWKGELTRVGLIKPDDSNR